MAKRVVDFSDYKEPEFEQYTGDDPKPNMWLTAELERAKYDEEADSMSWFFRVVDGPYTGWSRGFWTPFEGTRKFLFQELLLAIHGGKKVPFNIDPENQAAVDTLVKKAKRVRIRTEEYNDKIRIRIVRPLMSAAGDGKDAAPAPGPDLDTDSPADEPLEDYTEEELEAKEIAELEEILVEEFEIAKDDEDFPKRGRRDKDGSKYKEALIELILDEQDADGDGEGEAPAEGDGPDDGEFDDDFGGDAEPDPEPEPAKPARRSRAALAAAPAPEPAPTRTRRSRR